VLKHDKLLQQIVHLKLSTGRRL